MKGLKRYFQWLVGDNQGKVVEFIDITQEEGEYYYNFDDGESCNMSYICAATTDKNMLRGKAMVEVHGPYNAWHFEEIKTKSFTTAKDEHIEVPPLEDILAQDTNGNLESAVGTMRLIPPKSNPIKGMPLPSIQEYLRQPKKVDNQKTSGVETFVVEDQTKVNIELKSEPEKSKKNEALTNDPVYILVNTCKKHDTEISMTININLPSKSTYEFAKAEFENGAEKFIEILKDTIDFNVISDAIKNVLKETYENNN